MNVIEIVAIAICASTLISLLTIFFYGITHSLKKYMERDKNKDLHGD